LSEERHPKGKIVHDSLGSSIATFLMLTHKIEFNMFAGENGFAWRNLNGCLGLGC
jgi:hypothetical protein